MEERSASAPTAQGDKSPAHGTPAGVAASARPGPLVPVDNSGSRPTFPGRRERTRSRLARLTGRSTATYSPILEPLLRTVRANNPKEDFDLIQRAFDVAEQSHRGQKRKSGDPYITHPVAVATILAELGLSGTTLAAALLHDTV
ncbi:MAG: HD domain-containing protein, partial [Actinomycetes bacterium]